MSKFERQGILKHIKVLDFTINLAGVFNAWQFADMGADVWKIEPYGTGEQCRLFGPFTEEGFSVLYAGFNRNKRCIELDLKKPEGKEVIFELVKQADLVLENFRTGILDKLGVGYEVLKEINPKIVYASLAGFGTYGPLSKLPCYDSVACARGGLTSKTGEAEGAPLKPGFAIGDNFSGIQYFFGTIGALRHARKTGQGCRLEFAMMDGAMGVSATDILEYGMTGVAPKRTGDHHRFYAPHGMFPVHDGYGVVAVENQEDWFTFCDVLGHEEWKTDARYATNQTRLDHLSELVADITEVSKTLTRQEWEERLMAQKVPGAGVMKFEEVVYAKHMKESGALTFVHQEQVGRFPYIVSPVHYSDTPSKIVSGSPMLGDSTIDILTEIGMEPEKIQSYIDKEVLGIYNK